MAGRIAALVVLIAGLGVLAFVALRSDPVDQQIAAANETPAVADDNADNPATDNAAANNAAANNAATDNAAANNAATDGAAADDEGGAPAPALTEAEPEADSTPAFPEPENYGPRMDLVELDGWLNTNATSIDNFDGQVVLVEMWTFGCYNCKNRIPFTQSYYEEFADENFEIVGVHAPEFSYEADVANIENALVDLGVTWPVALDTNKKNFRAWQPGTTNYWPRTYVIDQNGDIRYDHIGEGKYEELRETIRFLIENPPAPSSVES